MNDVIDTSSPTPDLSISPVDDTQSAGIDGSAEDMLVDVEGGTTEAISNDIGAETRTKDLETLAHGAEKENWRDDNVGPLVIPAPRSPPTHPSPTLRSTLTRSPCVPSKLRNEIT